MPARAVVLPLPISANVCSNPSGRLIRDRAGWCGHGPSCAGCSYRLLSGSSLASLCRIMRDLRIRPAAVTVTLALADRQDRTSQNLRLCRDLVHLIRARG